MRIGVPREIKVHEYRVGLVPAGVRELTGSGHEVLVESGAGLGIGVDDAQYRTAGAAISASAAESTPELISATIRRLDQWKRRAMMSNSAAVR